VRRRDEQNTMLLELKWELALQRRLLEVDLGLQNDGRHLNPQIELL
jgi:hypothetical protein